MKEIMKKCSKMAFAACLIVPSFWHPAEAKSGNTTESALNQFREKVDKEYAFQTASKLTTFRSNKMGWRTAGSKAEQEASEYVRQEMLRIGLSDVKKEAFAVDKWEFKGAEMTVKGHPSKKIKLASYATKGTSEKGLSADLIYAGKGTKEDYKKVRAKGKVVLIDIDLKNDWWINYPALQAKKEGAAGVIAIVRDTYGTVSPDSLNTFDFTGPVTIPTMNVSVRNGDQLKALLKKKKSLPIHIKNRNEVSKGGKSYNVVGKIPGKANTGGIIIGGHLDGYFDGFNDNAASIGLMLSTAKAMKDSGYKPEHPIYFVGHAAEEYGAINSYFDWQVGSWNMINKLHPEWRGNSRLFVNTEFAGIKLKDEDGFSTNDEITSFVNQYLEEGAPDVNQNVYPKGYKVSGNNSTGSDDFSYSIAGVPTAANDRSGSAFFSRLYHTQFDNAEHADQNILGEHVKLYGSMVIYADQLPIMPIDFSTKLNRFLESIKEDELKSAGIDPSQLKNQTAEATALADVLSAHLKNINLENNRNKEELANAEKEMMAIFQMTQGDLMKLDWGTQPVFAHEELQKNVTLLGQIIETLEKGEGQAALDELFYQIEDEWYSYHFDRSVVREIAESAVKQPKERLFWGADKIVSDMDLSGIIQSVQKKASSKQADYRKEIEKLEEWKLSQEIELFKAIKKENDQMKQIKDRLKKVNDRLEN
ncbi:M28 family peptidase [Bacillus sp. FJAT-42376]|uniref:M28 family peptidase n=1 Tax=Bacillus sp. FJAT-42376 TaxID=2014076 RepID=UPI000F4D6B8B|nr:M28 family peptidase [Bacillus sp. FJAT-42376]AZB44187.1 M28 family peptidase [Bacillus sp. FJAT-42376]